LLGSAFQCACHGWSLSLIGRNVTENMTKFSSSKKGNLERKLAKQTYKSYAVEYII
jgi:phenylpropionate dioxygenase-like ring-hydroxylating dioxygenase large terminal subunit